jgi:single-strand DNA-binding protein
MSGMNKVILLGRLGSDPEVKTTSGGLTIAKFSLATSKQWKNDAGEKQEKTQWHKVVAFKKLGEIAGKYLTKGRQCMVEGEIEYRTWDKDDGTKGYATEIVANNLQFVGDGKPKTEDTGSQQQNNEPTFEDNSDIPF